jgi:hypothetical protein
MRSLHNNETEKNLEEVVNSTQESNVAANQEIHFTGQQQ